MTKFTSFIFLCFLTLSSFGQITMINKGTFYISPNTSVYLSGVDFINDTGASYQNEGNFYFAGNSFTNNGTMAQTSTGTTTFAGNNDQSIKGNSEANFNSLIIDHSAGAGMVTQEENEVHTNSMNILDGSSDFDYRVQDSLPLYVNNNITTDGDIRLIGEAQLIQTHNGTSLATGGKYLWRDQQGTTNQYKYNYWSAPVNQNGKWKLDYLKDGALGDNLLKSNYGDVQWVISTAATNDLPTQTHPIYLNAYWVYTFRNGLDGSYDAWFDNHIQNSGELNPGEGYTMKGPGVDKNLNPANGAATEYDSYTFAGVPNDGDYFINIDSGNDYLIGNPYPSALDANKFINDNNGKFNGSLYFWEHTVSNNHYTSNYEGGYAIYNLAGAVPAVSWKDNSTTLGTKTPGQFIPVAQGFFIWAENGQAGTVNFNNSQRTFKVEGNSSVFIKPSMQTDIRLGFEIPGNYHRQILLAIRPNTTFDIDYGWDGRNFDNGNPGADMNWNIDNKKYVIQSIPEINEETRLPLYINLAKTSVVGFKIDEIKNLPKQADGIFLEDDLLNISKKLDKNDVYNILLNEGEYKDRFYIAFKTKTNKQDEIPLDNVSVYMDNSNSELVILNDKNNSLDKLQIYAITGQLIMKKNIQTNEKQIRIPLNISTGMYLVTVIAKDGRKTTKKIIKN